MIVTDLSTLTRAHGDRSVFADLSWTIDDRARIGRIGPNGTGASTLRRTIAGSISLKAAISPDRARSGSRTSRRSR